MQLYDHEHNIRKGTERSAQNCHRDQLFTFVYARSLNQTVDAHRALSADPDPLTDLQVLDVGTLFSRVESYRTDLMRETMLYPGCRTSQSGRGVHWQFSKSCFDSPIERRGIVRRERPVSLIITTTTATP
jgi:hypothetical protein